MKYEEDDNGNILIYESLRKILKGLCASIAFVAIGFWLLEDNDSRYIFISYMCILFFGICAVVYIYELVFNITYNKPIITIGKEKIEFYHNIIERHKCVEFKDVKKFIITEICSVKFVGIILEKNQEETNSKGGIFKGLVSYNKNITGCKYNITTTTLSISATELCDLCNKQLEAWRNTQ